MSHVAGARNSDTAIIGMAGRFPGAQSVQELWSMLLAGHTGITDVESPRNADERWVNRAAALDGATLFDTSFFSIGDMEALLMDPQHRVMLDVIWEALEDAGHESLSGRQDVRVGVFTASSPSSYVIKHLHAAGMVDLEGIDYPVMLGNEKDFLSARISYQLDFHGPSMTVQSACSSSLVCVHLARRALQTGDCDVAIAGGVSIGDVRNGYRYIPGGIMSPDGTCHPFEETAQGTIRGEGAAAVVLRRSDDAQRDHDRIIAMISGSAVTNDGRMRAGFSAPGVFGQSSVIKEAMAEADVTGADIDYVETHGTGTALGDAIELRSLRTAHESSGALPTNCHLGAVKANLGHLDAAAGVAGLIKTALVIQHQLVPGQPDFSSPSADLASLGGHYEMSGGTVRAEVRHAAVSSFGMGGTDAHAILVPAPADDRPAADPATAYQFTISARDDADLTARMTTMADWIALHRPRGDDLAWTLDQAWRYPRRRSMTGTVDEFAEWCAGGPVPQDSVREPDPDCFLARRTALPPHPRHPRRFWPDDTLATPERDDFAGMAAHRAHDEGRGKGHGLEDVLRTASDFLRIPGLGPDDDLFDSGVDSIGMLQLLGILHDEHGIDISLQELIATPKLSTVLQALAGSPAASPEPPRARGANGLSGSTSPTWHTLREKGSRRLTLVHPAGGDHRLLRPLGSRVHK